MNPLDQHRDTIALVCETIPRAVVDQPLFLAPWQTRVFALIVALVKDGHFSWKSFQSRLAYRIAEAEKISDVGGSVMVENRYFDCWLLAVEETLADQGLIAGEEISQKIEDIRISVAGIRDAQKGRASREGI